jgi:hypothetical protein
MNGSAVAFAIYGDIAVALRYRKLNGCRHGGWKGEVTSVSRCGVPTLSTTCHDAAIRHKKLRKPPKQPRERTIR